MTTEHLVETTKTICQAKTRSGQPCRGWPDRSGYCPSHRPGHVEDCKKGGEHSALKFRAVKRLPAPLGDLLIILEQTIKEVHEGKLSPGAGSAISSLVSTSVKLLEYGSYDERLKQLEKDLQEAGLI